MAGEARCRRTHSGMAHEVQARPRVLVVDDDPQLVNIVTLYLQVQQIDVSAAVNGVQALEMMAGDIPDLLITDMMMPVMDGITLCREVRAMSGAEALPILVFTALDRDQDIRAALDAGADDVLLKPFDLTRLRDAVSALLHRADAA